MTLYNQSLTKKFYSGDGYRLSWLLPTQFLPVLLVNKIRLQWVPILGFICEDDNQEFRVVSAHASFLCKFPFPFPVPIRFPFPAFPVARKTLIWILLLLMCITDCTGQRLPLIVVQYYFLGGEEVLVKRLPHGNARHSKMPYVPTQNSTNEEMKNSLENLPPREVANSTYTKMLEEWWKFEVLVKYHEVEIKCMI